MGQYRPNKISKKFIVSNDNGNFIIPYPAF